MGTVNNIVFETFMLMSFFGIITSALMQKCARQHTSGEDGLLAQIKRQGKTKRVPSLLLLHVFVTIHCPGPPLLLHFLVGSGMNIVQI